MQTLAVKRTKLFRVSKSANTASLYFILTGSFIPETILRPRTLAGFFPEFSPVTIRKIKMAYYQRKKVFNTNRFKIHIYAILPLSSTDPFNITSLWHKQKKIT